ncbi:MAG: LysM peptidoglycan-binding domain-containing protein [Bacteroidetes bacterium]|nr:LysM peptidoglycan-binding domain-containing protein [Bacteroidota bacterium]
MPASGQKLSREAYINKYKQLAQEEMLRTGIPASIKMAQGMLETGNGNSTLAQKGNNHFGIKCHGWKGRKIYHDDDAKGECFRKYKSAEDSYHDHSEFLTNTPRYKELFELKEDDYKGWAKGLKKSGYATSRTYDKRLIQIIEENNLQALDKEVIAMRDGDKKPDKAVVYASVKSHTSGFVTDEKSINNKNGINYVVVKKGETVPSITEKLELFKWEIPKYNDFEHIEDLTLEAGQILYIQPKRNKADRKHKTHQVQKGEDMYAISQQYGIKLKKLYKLNRMEMDEQPEAGEVLNLRKKRDRDGDGIELSLSALFGSDKQTEKDKKEDSESIDSDVKVVFDPDE